MVKRGHPQDTSQRGSIEQAAGSHPDIGAPHFSERSRKMGPSTGGPFLTLEQEGQCLAHMTENDLEPREAIKYTGGEEPEEVQSIGFESAMETLGVGYT
jgi:hypothetical protein